MAIQLFVLPDRGGLYPRRVLIYFAEKNILNSPNIVITPTMKAPRNTNGELPTTLPILSLGNNNFVRQSIPIIEYFEDLCDAGIDEIAEKAGPTMRGITAAERARTREVLGLADEATTHFGVACHKGSAMFSLLEEQDTTASRMAFVSCRKRLEAIEAYYKQDERFNTGTSSGTMILDRVNVADCVLFALLQFSVKLYNRDLAEGLPTLSFFYEVFEKRDSARFGEGTFPEELRTLASHFVKESSSTWGSISATLEVAFVYVSVLAHFIFKSVVSLIRKCI